MPTNEDRKNVEKSIHHNRGGKPAEMPKTTESHRGSDGNKARGSQTKR